MKFLAALLAASFLFAPPSARVARSGQAQRGEIIEQVLVKVNGDIITKTDLERRQIAALRDRAKGRLDAETLKNDTELQKALVEVTGEILVNTIDELLMVQLGKEKGYSLRDEQFKAWLADLRKSNQLEDEAKFQAALKQEGYSIDDLRKNVERSFLVQRVQQDEIGAKLTITEEEARQYYLSHKDEFAEVATVTLREIFIETPTSTQKGQAGVNVGADDEALKKAEAVRARLSKGEDFATLVAEVSDSGSKANGGLIGPFPMSDLSDSLRQMVQTMKPGDITQPLKTPRGYQILKLDTLKPASIQPFESVRDMVADRVSESRQEAEIKKFLARVRSQALIEWKNADLKKLYDQALAHAGTQSN
jgi:peptidyl-prolyl cis-trans isomerase SurA